MIPGSANPLLLASAAGAGDYAIERSLRFNSADSAYLNRTPASDGNRKTFTWAGWVKRSKLGIAQSLFSGDPTQSYGILHFPADDTLGFDSYGLGYLYTSAKFRDTSAWLHIVLSVDTTNATAADRIILYVNGVRNYGSSSNPTQNTDLYVNQSGKPHYIGRYGYSIFEYYLDGYLADIHFIDGQALAPTSFGEFDTNGIWQPKAYSGTYGTNGFHLTFSDNSTAGSLGDDSSNNGNNWTVNNISVAAGAGNDSLIDVPTNGTETDTGLGGEVKGNYCTLNPLKLGSGYTLSNGNLDVAGNGANLGAVGTIGFSSGKWYWEITISSGANADMAALGITSNTSSPADGYAGSTATNGWSWRQSGSLLKVSSNITVNNTPTTYTNNDVLQIAFDADAGKVWLGKNGTITQILTYTASEAPYFPVTRPYSGSSVANFGQRPFAYTAPSGFKALNTANLPSTTITTSGSYTGNGVADGPFVFLNGVPTAMTIGGNSVTFGTDADKLSNGFKIRTTSTTFNQNASTYNYSITSTGDPFKTARAQAN